MEAPAAIWLVKPLVNVDALTSGLVDNLPPDALQSPFAAASASIPSIALIATLLVFLTFL